MLFWITYPKEENHGKAFRSDLAFIPRKSIFTRADGFKRVQSVDTNAVVGTVFDCTKVSSVAADVDTLRARPFSIYCGKINKRIQAAALVASVLIEAFRFQVAIVNFQRALVNVKDLDARWIDKNCPSGFNARVVDGAFDPAKPNLMIPAGAPFLKLDGCAEGDSFCSRREFCHSCFDKSVESGV